MKITLILLQVVCLIAVAPLISGIIRKIKNNLRMRVGAPVLQPYYNIFKFFGKEEVVSENVSWIFSVAPYVVLASAVAALVLVPAVKPGWAAGSLGDILAVILLLGAGRFFLALAGLDAGSAFGGMGSSREVFIAALAEPAALMAVFAACITGGSTNLAALAAYPQTHFSSCMAALALGFVTLAETSRLPVDNQETHLELTMIHEAMVLEYSGRGLALIELAAYVKQIVFFTLIAAIIVPPGIFPGLAFAPALALYAVKILCMCAVVAVIEVAIAKMRLFRVADFLLFAFVVAGIAAVLAVMGL